MNNPSDNLLSNPIVVVPTIREDSIKSFLDAWKNEFRDLKIIVVEDNPSRTFDLNYGNVEHFLWESIDRDLGKESWIIPRRTDCIRSYGFWKAYHQEPEFIITLDDDCYPYHVERGTVYTHGVIQVPLNALRAPIHTPTGIRLMAVEETPHFQWIQPLIDGNDSACASKVYREYLELFFPELDPGAELDKMRSLVSSFQSESGNDGVTSILTYQPIFEKRSDPYLVVYDGLCEAVIAKALGCKIIQCRLVSERWMPPNNLDIS